MLASPDSALAIIGTGARRFYGGHFARCRDLTYLAMPSTSPAHAWLDFARQPRKMGRLERNPGHYPRLRDKGALRLIEIAA